MLDLSMVKFIGVLLLSFFFTAGLSIPFINLLYHLKFRSPRYKSKDFAGDKPIYNQLHGHKAGTPTGGGILVIVSAFLFSIIFYTSTKFDFNWTSNIIFLALFAFGSLGLLDDLQKFFGWKRSGFFGLRPQYKIILQLIIAAIVSWLIYAKMGVSSVRFPIVGGVELGYLFIPYATLMITFFTNAFNITDGLDGLAGGLLLFALIPLWYLASFSVFGGDVSLFIVVLLGALLAFLYFNINPARFFMGDCGALALGATLAVVSLIINASVPLFIIGLIFVVEAFSSLIQWGSKWLRHGKKVFKIAPLHHHLEASGWNETKVTMRFWLAGIFLAFFGLLFALL